MNPKQEIDDALESGDAAAIERVRRKCLEETAEGLSFLARGLLGCDYWKVYETGEVNRQGMEWDGEWRDGCGFVDWGPHGEMANFLAEPPESGKVKLLMTSRGGLKTTGIQAKAVQKILKDPNIRIVVLMATGVLARDTLRVIKGHLTNPRIEALFGKQKGPIWGRDAIEVAGRTQTNMREPTVLAVGVEGTIVGYHFDLALIDDLVDWKTSRSVDQMKKGIDCYIMLQPIMDPGSQQYVTMTPYHEEDLSHHLRYTLGDHVQSLVIDCGMSATLEKKGSFGLQGTPRFPHHTEKFLTAQLAHMGPYDFNTQYALKIHNPLDQVFHRDQFHVAEWDDEFIRTHAYILTDTAMSATEYSSKSVIALVLLDWDDRAYLADLRVGYWSMGQFVEQYLDVYSSWQSRTRICGVVMEQIVLNKAFRSTMEHAGRQQGILARFIQPTRSNTQKATRIMGLTARFARGDFRVLDTVPRIYEDRGRTKVLWDPQGFETPVGPMPGGELVDNFLRFRQGDKDQHNVDIADAIADIELCDSSGKRVLRLPPKPSTVVREELAKRRKKRKHNVVPRALVQPARQNSRGSFWSRMMK